MRNRIVVLFVFSIVAAVAGSAQAQDNEYWRAPAPGTTGYTQLQSPPDNTRANKSEIFGEVGYQQSDSTSTTFDGLFEDLKVKPSYLGGIGLGHNFGSYLNANIDATFGPEQITGTVTGPGGSVPVTQNSILVSRYMFNVELYPLKTCITPLLTAGVGAIHTYRGDIAPNTDLNEWDLAYDAGAGLRWDLKDSISLKLIYKVTWTHFHDFNDNQMFNGLFLTVAWRF